MRVHEKSSKTVGTFLCTRRFSIKYAQLDLKSRQAEQHSGTMTNTKLNKKLGDSLGEGADELLGPNTEIGSKLRMLFSKVEQEAIPDRFLDLLEKLDQAEQGSSSSGTGAGE